MLEHNKKMQFLLRCHGIDCMPKRIDTGSLRGTWRLYKKGVPWTDALRVSLDLLGFLDFDNKPLGPFSGNGGRFSVFVRAPKEIEAVTRQATEGS